MFDRILVPLDGSPLSAEAVPYVEQIPSRTITLLTVNAEAPVRWHEIASTGDVGQVRMEPGAPSSIDAVAARLRDQGRDVEVRRATGDPAEVIMAEAAHADLIIMATHGRGGIERAMLGNTADRVIREGHTPTLAVRGRGAARTRPITRIVVPLDPLATEGEALVLATRLAALLGLPIHLIQVVGSPGEVRDAASWLLEQERRLQRAHFSVTGDVRVGSPAETILAHLGASDLVVMTTRGHGGLRRLVEGSVADQLVRFAPGPVLIQRAGAAASAEVAPAAPVNAVHSVLVVTASKHGSTREIARSIAAQLRARGFAVDMSDPADDPDPGRYDAVVLGSAVYVGRWLADAREFIDRHREALRARPVWLFSSGPLEEDGSEPRGDPFGLPDLMAATGARGHRVFAGRLDMDDLGLGERILTKAVMAREGDFRDWPATWAWADEIADALVAPTAGR